MAFSVKMAIFLDFVGKYTIDINLRVRSSAYNTNEKLSTDYNYLKNMKEIGNYINQNAILRIGFMSSSVIYIIDDTLSIKLIDTQRIKIIK